MSGRDVLGASFGPEAHQFPAFLMKSHSISLDAGQQGSWESYPLEELFAWFREVE